MNEAYDQGYEAGYDDYEPECPYEDGSQEFKDWWSGYEDGSRDS